jgi:hypothetical protein
VSAKQNERKNIMKRILLAAALIAVCLSTSIISCAKSNPEAEKAAISAAEQWLALLDEGKYGESWDSSASIFQAAVTRENWDKTLSQLKPPFGKLVSRKIRSATYMTSMPGAPDGQYVVIQYKTAFEHKAHAVETVTPMLDSDGQWKVSGYYIK